MSDTLLRMRLFVAVYEERSFTAAALRENATQSGVTQHIHKLEAQHSVKLLVRGTGNVQPTPAGDAYYRACIDVLRAHELSRRTIQTFGHSLEGEVVVGLTPTLTRAALAPALARFVDSHPNVVVRVLDAYSDIVTEKVRAGEVDFGIVPGIKYAVGLKSELFARTPEFLVSGLGSGLGLKNRRPVRLSELGPLKFVLPSRAQARRESLETYFAATGAQIERRLEIDTSFGTLDFVTRTDWVSINPGLSMLREADSASLILSPLVEPTLMLNLYLIERARQPMAAEAVAFLGCLREETIALQRQADALTRIRKSITDADRVN